MSKEKKPRSTHQPFPAQRPAALFDATAVGLQGEDYDKQWAEITAFYPVLAEHGAKTDRTIPVVELQRD